MRKRECEEDEVIMNPRKKVVKKVVFFSLFL